MRKKKGKKKKNLGCPADVKRCVKEGERSLSNFFLWQPTVSLNIRTHIYFKGYKPWGKIEVLNN